MMVDKKFLLTSNQVAEFVARGVLRFDEIVPDEINKAIVAEMDAGTITSHPAGTPFSKCYPDPSPIGKMLRMPEIQGIVQSLVGPDSNFDHHAVHVRQPNEAGAQGLHGDAIIDTRMHFDVQIMYFPHDVTLEMGGTLLLPGSHFRRINEGDVGRYQNFLGQMPIVCKAGSMVIVHHGIWHAGRQNKTDRIRYMFKVRLNPTVRQYRLWNTDDLMDNGNADRIIYGGSTKPAEQDVQTILNHAEPWFEASDGRIEIVSRIKLWRFLTGDEDFDCAYWLTRIENRPENMAVTA
jgi:hypothetical protein